MLLLKLAQDLVALNVRDGRNIANDRPLIGWRGLGRIVRSGDCGLWSKGREDLVGRAQVDVVEVEGPEHAQRSVAVRGGRLFGRRRRCLWETSSALRSILIERVNARQWPIVLIPARTGHLPDLHSTSELIRRVALILIMLALMASSFHHRRFAY
jgi:hypothetical protein